MSDALSRHFPSSTVLIMAAAVSDFRSKMPAGQKLKKQGQSDLLLELEATPDILAMLSARRTSQIVVGFAAETEQVLSHATDKLRGKGLDLIIANDVAQKGSGFKSDDNAVVILSATGKQKALGLMPKRCLADEILTAVHELCLTSPRRESLAE
jgi:phosphopantothenoylcysteine decarboxylase/phosphopantothenate--cysteine ligase